MSQAAYTGFYGAPSANTTTVFLHLHQFNLSPDILREMAIQSMSMVQGAQVSLHPGNLLQLTANDSDPLKLIAFAQHWYLWHHNFIHLCGGSMAKLTPGSRVGAILSASGDVIRLLGYGVYDGDHEPPAEVLGMSPEELQKTYADAVAQGLMPEGTKFTNPRITLDDGSVVWGMQCWWGPEESIKREVTNYLQIQLVHLDGTPKFDAPKQ